MVGAGRTVSDPLPYWGSLINPQGGRKSDCSPRSGCGFWLWRAQKEGLFSKHWLCTRSTERSQETGPGCYRALAPKSVAAQETGHGKASPVCPVLLVPNRISQAMAKKCVADPPSFKMSKEEKTNQPNKQNKKRSLCHCVTSLSSSQGHETFYFWSRHTCPLSLPHRVRV